MIKKKKNNWSFSYPSKEKDYFVENFSMLLASGMGVLSTLKILKEDVKSKRSKKFIGSLIKEIEEGTPLWRAIENTGLFSGYFVSLLKIGEESGSLDSNLKIIVKQAQKEKTFKSKIRSAIMYPAFVMILALVVGVGIAWFILPKLATVFSSLRMDLPYVTKVLINLGLFLAEQGYWIIPSFLIFFILIIFFLFSYPKTKFIGRSILFSLPGSGKIIQQVEVSRFGFILGTLLDAGMPVKNCFDSLIQATSFPAYKKFFSYLKEEIIKGNDFNNAFLGYKKSNKLMPISAQKMVSSGQSSGNLSTILKKISENMEIKTEVSTKNLSVILEPVLLVVVWLGVVGVALAVILPIYSLVGGINEEKDNNINTNSEQLIIQEDISKNISENKEEFVGEVDLNLKENNNEDDIEKENIIINEIEGQKEEFLEENGSLFELEILDNSLGYLNVRDRNSINGKIVYKVYPGDKYFYEEKENDWYKIEYLLDEYGWVYGRYIKEVNYE